MQNTEAINPLWNNAHAVCLTVGDMEVKADSERNMIDISVKSPDKKSQFVLTVGNGIVLQDLIDRLVTVYREDSISNLGQIPKNTKVI